MADDDQNVVAAIDRWFDELNALERRQAVMTAPSDEPLQWTDRRTRLVRLDVAIFAFHLFALRVGVKSIPGMIRQRVQSVLAGFGKWLGTQIGVHVFGEVFGKVLAPIKLLYTVWSSDKAQLEFENAVRRNGIKTMRELYLFKLRQQRSNRPRERVLTRHPIPKQRRPNGHARKRPRSHHH